ncbi:unnamed protein product, partial [Thlaspi arvense]
TPLSTNSSEQHGKPTTWDHGVAENLFLKGGKISGGRLLCKTTTRKIVLNPRSTVFGSCTHKQQYAKRSVRRRD